MFLVILDKLYFVRADITDAFGSVSHKILISIIKEKLREFCGNSIQLYRINEWRVKNKKIFLHSRFTFCSQPKKNSLKWCCTLYKKNGEKLPQFRLEEFEEIIHQVVSRQRVEIKGKIYCLTQGLAQGGAGKFSPQFCEIYLLVMDEHYFSEFISCSDCLLLRAADDYMLITSKTNHAKKFLNTLKNGVESFNIKFNKRKLKSNILENLQEVSFLGLTFNFQSMSVTPDYSNCKYKNVISTIKIPDKDSNIHFKKSYFLEQRAMCIGALKVYPIVLNRNCNSLEAIRETVLQACHMQALRVMTLSQYLFPKKENHLQIFSVLLKCSKQLQNLMSLKNDLPKKEIGLLFARASLETFKKCSGKFKTLLILLRFYLAKCERLLAV